MAAETMAAAPISQAQLDAEEILALIVTRLDEDKAEDLVTIDLRGKTSIADFMVVASGRSQRHVGATAEHLIEALKAAGVRQIRVEGQPACDWVLIDAGDVIVHIFQPEVRSFYNIEKMWSGTARA
ncbi:Iojap-related protein precursor [Azorhizobium caulinodans ORS 571]|uniref:Ribosomal silencing factor RsfS n=2 Tax=Azorhizobium caulinodans TaxID=7 RepID=A8HS39_AZOC5|nr:Iojap-related protein precursor [Azorhizobium caulinodans ORS 571]